MRNQKQTVGDDGSTLVLKPTGRVNRSPKQRAPVAPQNGDLSPQKFILKKKSYFSYFNKISNLPFLAKLPIAKAPDILR